MKFDWSQPDVDWYTAHARCMAIDQERFDEWLSQIKVDAYHEGYQDAILEYDEGA